MAKVVIEEKSINELVKQSVREALKEIFSDPDFGLELRAWVKKRLLQTPQKLIPAAEIKKKYL